MCMHIGGGDRTLCGETKAVREKQQNHRVFDGYGRWYNKVRMPLIPNKGTREDRDSLG